MEVEKTGLLRGKKHTFVFKSYSGTVDYDAGRPQNSAVRLVIEGGSMICIDDWVSDRDRGKILAWGLNSMIEMSRFPKLIFDSEAIMPIAPGKYEVTGTLTIRNAAKPAKILISGFNKTVKSFMFKDLLKYT